MRADDLTEWIRESHRLAEQHGWSEESRRSYVRWRENYEREKAAREQERASREDAERAAIRWWYWPIALVGKLLVLPAFLVALLAFWVVPPLVWGTTHGASVHDVLAYVAYANEGETTASGVFTPFHTSAYYALALFNVSFWLVVGAVLVAPIFILGWWLERRELRAVDEVLRRKGITS